MGPPRIVVLSVVCAKLMLAPHVLSKSFPPPFLFTIKYFHKYFTVESTPLIFTQSDTFYEYCDLKNVANFRLRIFTGIRFVLRKSSPLSKSLNNLSLAKNPVVGGLGCSSSNGL